MGNLTLEGKHWRDKAVNRLRRRMPDDREDMLNALIVDAVADLVLAARAEGFTWDVIYNGMKRGYGHAIADKTCDKFNTSPYRLRGGECSCRPGQARDNCPACEGTGQRIDFAAIRARKGA